MAQSRVLLDLVAACTIGPPVFPSTRRAPVSPLKLEEDCRPPTNLYAPDAPYTITILSVEKISGPNSPDMIFHIVFDHRGFFPHWEGQVVRIMRPNPDNAFEPGFIEELKPFFFASSRYGDYFDGNTASLCVRLKPNDVTKRALCEALPGDKFQVVGPIRVAALLGDYGPSAKHIFVSSDTAISSFRAHLRRFFKEDIPSFKFSGLAWLFQGASHADNVVYQDEFEHYLEQYPDNFRYNQILNNEYFVGDIAGSVYDLLVGEGAFIYIAGLRDMVHPIEMALRQVAIDRGQDWDGVLAMLKKKDQWRVVVFDRD